jgi:hypothetical protein
VELRVKVRAEASSSSAELEIVACYVLLGKLRPFSSSHLRVWECVRRGAETKSMDLLEGTEVCVTGGTGYIASRLIQALLQRGYKVRTTARNPGRRWVSSTLFSSEMLSKGCLQVLFCVGCRLDWQLWSYLCYGVISKRE